jgi:hypothetical protein
LDKSSSSKSFLSVQTIVLAELAWAILALLFFLLFSVTKPGQELPVWYSIGTSIFEAVAYLVASFLCFRNWRSPQIVSGRNVWLCIGLGMLCYFIGNLLFAVWEIGFGLKPDISLGDFFFIPTYIFLIVGMVLAVASRRLNLEVWQWGVITGIALAGIVLAVLSSPSSESPQSLLMQPAAAQSAPAKPPAKPAAAKASPKPASPPGKSQPAAPSPSAAPSASPTPQPAAPTAEPKAVKPAAAEDSKTDAESPNAPEWAKSLDKSLQSLKGPINFFYVISDVVLLIIAGTLLLAFWGGRFAQSWRMIAAAALCLYIADVAFKIASRDPNYQSGGLLEVGWVWSGVLFGIGAALEYDVSSRSRTRAGGRRRAS